MDGRSQMLKVSQGDAWNARMMLTELQDFVVSWMGGEKIVSVMEGTDFRLNK